MNEYENGHENEYENEEHYDTFLTNYKPKTFKLSYDMISQTELKNLADFITSGKQLSMSSLVSKFEEEFAKFVDSPFAVMVNSGSSANLLAFAVATNSDFKDSLKHGDEVLLPCVCWSTSLFPIVQTGLTPVFVDTDPDTLQICIKDLERKITSKTKAILLVHVLGNCVNMDAVMGIARKHGLLIIEDSCEALGTKMKHKNVENTNLKHPFKQSFKHAGTFGCFGTYSFFYSHHITTIEGGMVVCQNEYDMKLLKCLRAHGWAREFSNEDKKALNEKYPDIDPRFLFVNVGYNLRPTEINAFLGLSQLQRLNDFNNTRRENYKNIKECIEKHEKNQGMLSVLKDEGKCEDDKNEDDNYIAWFAFPIFLEKTKGVFGNEFTLKDYTEWLTRVGVENRPIISGNFCRQPVIQKLVLKCVPEDYPGAERVHKQGFYIGLPCTEVLERKDVNILTEKLLRYFYLKPGYGRINWG